jgi:hypothetical protein
MWHHDRELHGARIRATAIRRRNDLVFHPRTEYPVLDLEEFVLADELGVYDLSGEEEQRM